METSVPRKTNDRATTWFSHPTSLYLFKENKITNLKRLLQAYVHCRCIYNQQEIWNQPVCASVDEEIKNMSYMYTVLFAIKRGNPAICNSMDET